MNEDNVAPKEEIQEDVFATCWWCQTTRPKTELYMAKLVPKENHINYIGPWYFCKDKNCYARAQYSISE